MSPVLVVVADIVRKEPHQVALVESDDVVQQIAATTLDPPFRCSILPRTAKRGSNRIG